MSQTETPSLHQWGALTLFHGLPSDQVRAVAQDSEGQMWFGTDAGLARYDGRRIQTVTDEGLRGPRTRALRVDAGGALWVGADGGAYVRAAGASSFVRVEETREKSVRAILTPEAGRALLATADGLVFDCRLNRDGTLTTKQLGASLTVAAGKPQALQLTSLALSGETVVVGTRGRGLMTIEPNGETKEIVSRPRVFYVEALEHDASDSGGALYFGAQTSGGDSGVFRVEGDRLAQPRKLTGAQTGTVTALASDGRGLVYAATDGRGVYAFRGGQLAERFTFAGTAGGLRSDEVNAVFVDREGVAWFGTSRGVCRYDPRGVRVERTSEETEGNFVRSLYMTSRGRLLAGTNRGLFARGEGAASWREVEEVAGKTVYSIAEDNRGLLLVGTSAGLYVGLQPDARTRAVKLAPEEKTSADAPKNDEGVAPGNEAGSTKDESDAVKSQAGESKPDGGASKKDGAESKTKADGAKADEGKAKSVEGDTKVNEGGEKGEGAGAKKTVEPALSGSVRAIARFGDATYVATFGRGLERFEGAGRRTLIWPRDGDDARAREVVSLYADDARGRLWIGTANAGAFYFDGSTVKSEPALAQLKTSTVWGASSREGWLWLATSRGLYTFREGDALKEVVPGVDARAVAVVASSSDSKNSTPQAWCATAGAGVLRVAIDEQLGAIASQLNTEHGLPTENAFAVLAIPSEVEGGVSLLVGTTRGLARYEPGTLAPVLRITRVTASRTIQPEELRGSEPLRLAYPQSGLVIDVAAGASRTFPEQFQYAFTLRDSKGSVVKQRLSHDSQFQFEKLPAGTYTLTARAFSLDLTPSAPLAFDFEVARAPFPKTIVALSVLLALALGVAVWTYTQHRRAVRSREELREVNRQLAAARLQLASEAEAERRRIARDLHDQTLADLRRLLLLTDEMQRNEAPAQVTGGGMIQTTTASVVDPSELRAEIESISQEVRRICEDLSPSVLENVGFAAALEWALSGALAHMPEGRRFEYEFSCDEGLEERLGFAPGVQMQVYRIVQEAVSNVCRHAHAAHVHMRVRLDDEDSFTLTLEDDGAGFDPSNRRALKGRGLAGIRARASLIEAEADWHAREGGGTIFTLRKRTKK
ncbi:MAG TPA: two-component regulator propeller domain-containing protein [Pyrinomonadaceae bacterium]|nr:two-component regulator propeller domain-containing protein [Pyrinomonadaceae bacterium]